MDYCNSGLNRRASGSLATLRAHDSHLLEHVSDHSFIVSELCGSQFDSACAAVHRRRSLPIDGISQWHHLNTDSAVRYLSLSHSVPPYRYTYSKRLGDIPAFSSREQVESLVIDAAAVVNVHTGLVLIIVTDRRRLRVAQVPVTLIGASVHPSPWTSVVENLP